jgi:uncharacterized protein YaiI (UPF0178 family)
VIEIYIDADSCPVKDEVYRVAQRHGFSVIVVANKPMNIPHSASVRMEIVSKNPDAADDWIAENIKPFDICITSDIPLANRCLKAEAAAISSKGDEWTEDNIGDALATREIMKNLRDMGEMRGGPAAMTPRDRSAFLSGFEQLIQKILRKTKRP